jgi:hypothetical protein
MLQPSNLAGLQHGTTPVSQIIPSVQKPSDEGSKYKAFVDAIYHVAHPTTDQQIDQQTRLEWENIEGEVMLEVLKADIISGVPFLEITDDPIFRFSTRQELIDDMFFDIFIEKLTQKHLLPSMAILKRKLNELLVSHKGAGRAELIQMFQAFTVSMAEHEHTDALRSRLGGRLP